MEFNNFEYVWLDGGKVSWKEAKIHLMTHALHYGTSVIEGIRAYASKDNLFIFRLEEHVKRLLDSAKVYSLNIRYSKDEIMNAIIDIIRYNGIKGSCYIRPIGFAGFNGIDLYINTNSITHLAILLFKFEGYLNPNGIRACVSSWRRISDPSLPPLAKAGGNYLNSVLATQECKRNNYDEAIMLDSQGNVSEAPGENIFIIRKGKIFTPGLSSGILEGITRDTAITIARDLGYDVVEKNLPRTELYLADEIFLTGTAAEIAPVISVDNNIIGDGKVGKITSMIKETYSKAVRGELEVYRSWLTPVW